MSSLLSLRNVISNQTQINTAGLTVNNTALALGTSAGATKTNFSNGSYAATSWQTAQSGLNANKKIQMSATGQYQLDLTSPTPYLSSDSGATWTALGTSNGLPTGATWLNGALSASGQYITLADSTGGSLYVSSDYGATFNNTTPTASVASLYSWLKFNGNATDSQGVSTITVVGAPSYATGYLTGTQAINLANTAGTFAAATKYIRGSWSGAPNFTVSFWMNPQTVSSSYYQIVFSAYGTVSIAIEANGAFSLYVPGGYVNTGSLLAKTNTWYYVTGIFQTNGLCSFYLNNTLIGTVMNVGGFGTTTAFELSGSDSNQAFAFNGYLADFKLTNAAITYQPVPIIPPAVWLKFENNTTDSGSNAITPTLAPTWTPAYVTGAVGLSALRLANTASGTATQYVRGSWVAPSSFTISFWFNVQSLTSNYQVIFDTFGGGLDIYINPSNSLAIAIPSGGGSSKIELIPSYPLIINTWYHLTFIFQSNSTCSAYVNGVSVGNATNSGGLGTFTGTKFGLGTYDTLTANAFNGYIDDFRFYNTAVPFTPMIPANYNAVALSGSGQYQLASTKLGTVIQSADYGVTWTTNAAAAGPQQSETELALSHAGQYAVAARRKVVVPNTTASWAPGSGNSYSVYNPTNGLTWTANTSSNLAGAYSYPLFDDNSSTGWTSSLSAGNLYDGTTGAYTGGGTTTTVLTLTPSTTVAGEWIQIQCSVPVTMSGFNFSAGLVGQVMKTYVLCGSLNGTTWYPLQQGTMTANPITTTYGRVNTVVTVNYTGVQSLKGDQVGSVTTTAYSYATGAYLYFRLVATSIWASGGVTTVAFGEFYPQFITSTISPQLTGLSTTTWAQAGVNYTASASSIYGGTTLPPYLAFNNNYTASNGWASPLGTYNTTTGVVVPAGPTTIISTIGSVNGEWIQLQTSVPLTLQSYNLAALTDFARTPRIYYFVGSNDGSTWFPLHFATMNSNPFTTNYTAASSYITINYTGSQTMTAGAVATIATTSYPTSTASYLYFRMVINSVFPNNDGITHIGELFLNFATPSLVSNNTLSTWSANAPQIATSTNVPDSTALSASGQYLLQTTKIQPYAWLPFDATTTPQLAGLASSTWTTNGVTWTSSSSSYYAFLLLYSYGAFNRIYNSADSANTYSWGSATGTYSLSSPYGPSAGAPSTTIQTIGATAGEWIQIQSSVPLTMASYSFACGGFPNLPKTYYIVGSTDGTTWYPLQYVNMNTNPLTANFQTWTTVMQMNVTGTQTIQGNVTATGSTTAYSYTTQAFTYFRCIATNVFGAGGLFELGEWYINFGNPATDLMANTALTVTGSPAYTTDRLGNSTGAINLANTAGGTATKYVRGTNSFGSSFTVSGWFNLQSIPPSGIVTTIFGTCYGTTYSPVQISYYTNVVGYNGIVFYSATQSLSSVFFGYVPTPATNTWYHFTIVYQSGVLYSYLNGALVGSGTVQIFSPNDAFCIGAHASNANAFNGYIDDFRIYNTALNATQINALYNNQTALQCPSLSSSYLPSTGYTMPTSLAPSNPINASATSFNGQVMAVTTSGADVPLARLTLDNTAADSQGALTATTGAGTVTYSTTVKKVGTHSAFFNNYGGYQTDNYLNYTVPSILSNPSSITISCWVYPTALPTINDARPIGFNNGTTTPGPSLLVTQAGRVGAAIYNTSVSGTSVTSLSALSINTWSHIAMTYVSGTLTLYLNGIQQGTASLSGNLALSTGAALTNLFVGGWKTDTSAFQGYVDDVRLYSQALTATEIQSLYTYNNATNNVHYSTNYGVTWTPATVPSTESLQGITVSADGSYLTAISNTATYTLNANSSGYSLAVGNQAGQINQAVNAIAIGNQAGQRNQTANSIVLNATGSAVNAQQSGFYVAPIAQASSSASGLLQLLGYGADSQIVQSGITVTNATDPRNIQVVVGSYVAPTTNSPGTTTFVNYGNFNLYRNRLIFSNALTDWNHSIYNNYTNIDGEGTWDGMKMNVYNGLSIRTGNATGATPTTALYINSSANVGIGTNNPGAKLQVYGTSYPNILIGGPNSSIELVTNTSTPYNCILRGNGGRLDLEAPGNYPRLSIDPATGNVGIGTTNPTAALLSLWYTPANTNTGGMRFHNDNSGTQSDWNVGPNSSANFLVVRSDGVGVVLNWGATSWTSNSDRSLKKDIVSIENCLSSICQLNPVSYRLKSNPDNLPKTLGLIAQEVQPYLPEVVHTITQNENGEVMLGITYTDLIPVLIGAVKELSQENTALKVQLTSLFAWAKTQGFSA